MNCESATLITGATGGIGRHLAQEFARHGHSLILVAPDAAALEALALQLQTKHDIKTCCIARDLEDPEAANEIPHEVHQRGLVVDLLVNTADRELGDNSGEPSIAQSAPIAQSIAILRLNIEAVVHLTHSFLLPMLKSRQDHLRNTSSVTGLEDGLLLNVCHASRAFVLSWSDGLASELTGAPLNVSAPCPGFTATASHPKADKKSVRTPRKGGAISPPEVAKEGEDDDGTTDWQLIVVPGIVNQGLAAGHPIVAEHAQTTLTHHSDEKWAPEAPTPVRDHICSSVAGRSRHRRAEQSLPPKTGPGTDSAAQKSPLRRNPA